MSFKRGMEVSLVGHFLGDYLGEWTCGQIEMAGVACHGPSVFKK
jgi:hypothetical protein